MVFSHLMTLQELLPLPRMSSHIWLTKTAPKSPYETWFGGSGGSYAFLCIPTHPSFYTSHTLINASLIWRPVPGTPLLPLYLTSVRPNAGVSFPKEPFLTLMLSEAPFRMQMRIHGCITFYWKGLCMGPNLLEGSILLLLIFILCLTINEY